MTGMCATREALRPELAHLAEVTVRLDDNPRKVLCTSFGRRLFKTFVQVQHRTEVDMVWPALRQSLADRPDDPSLLEVIEAEHAGGDEAIDAVLTDPDAGLDRLGDLVDSLAICLTGYLKHERADLTDPRVDEAAWRAGDQVGSGRAIQRGHHWL